MRIRKKTLSTAVITTVSFQGSWIKLLQAQSGAEGVPRLLGMKARQVAGMDEEQMSAALKELVGSLPLPPQAVLGLLPTGEVLTRYLSLPSEDPEELRAMALYQLEGMLPFSIRECLAAVKVLGRAGEATRVLVATAHRPVVERLVRICRSAGLNLTGIAASSEAIGNWHRACWPAALGISSHVWLAAEITSEGLEMGILINGGLVYMRQVYRGVSFAEDLAAKLQETIQAYEKEQVGPPVEQITLSGSLEGLQRTPMEQLERILGLPVHRVDPLEASPFKETLSVTAQELAPEVSFSELLGVACAPRLLELDLLPVEAQWDLARQAFFHRLRATALLVGLGMAVGFSWAGMKIGGTSWMLRQTQEQSRLLEPQVDWVKHRVADIRAVFMGRQEYPSRWNV